MNNYEKIKKYTLDEMAEYVHGDTEMGMCVYCPCSEQCDSIRGTEQDEWETCFTLVRKWLESEVEES